MSETHLLVINPYTIIVKTYYKSRRKLVMYNYDLRQDYYNYNNNNYNKPLYIEDANPNSVYDPYAGFLKGNMFPNLYNSYKISKPIEIRPTSEREQMLAVLDSLDFATIDINLYLDIYPNDKDMIELFNQYRMEANKLREEFESSFGPLLTSSNASMAYPWAWDNKPWPWENK